MDGIRINEEDMQDSLVVEEGMMVKFPLALFATCACPPSLAAPVQRFFLPKKSFKKIIDKLAQTLAAQLPCVCLQRCGKKCKTNNNNRHKTLVSGKPHHWKSFCNFSMWERTTIDEIILNVMRRGRRQFWPASKRGQTLACFNNKIQIAKDTFPTLQLTIICYETKESVRKTQNSINCAASGFLRVNGKSWLLKWERNQRSYKLDGVGPIDNRPSTD